MINIINQILKEQYLNNILKRGKDEILGYKLNFLQKEFFNKDKEIVLINKPSRQVGASIGCVLKAIELAIKNNNTKTLLLARSKNNVKYLYYSTMEILKKNNIEYLTKDSMCVLEIILLNGSSIKFESCFGKDSLRGEKTDYLIADEIEKGRNKASYLDIILSDIKYEQAYCID